MMRSRWLAVLLCLTAFALPGCGGASAPASAPARSAPSTTSKDLDEAARGKAPAKASSNETEAILSQEEGHPFWNVVGATLGLVTAILVVALVLGGF